MARRKKKQAVHGPSAEVECRNGDGAMVLVSSVLLSIRPPLCAACYEDEYGLLFPEWASPILDEGDGPTWEALTMFQRRRL